MTYNQLFILNYEGKILKINSTKQDNYHEQVSISKEISILAGSCHGMTLHLNTIIKVEPRHGVAH
jgi:hypothetical protein